MTNHPKFAEWQRAIQLLKARDAIEQAPADVKKDVGDKLKLLESVVNKFNTCFDDIDKRQGLLEDVLADSGAAYDDLVARFDTALGDTKQVIKTAITNIDNDITTAKGKPGTLRGDPQKANLPNNVPKLDLNTLQNQKQAETARDDAKIFLASVERELKDTDMFCAEVPKREAEVTKAQNAAAGTLPGNDPIGAWTNILNLGALKAKIATLVGQGADNRTDLKAKADLISKLIGVQNGKVTGLLVHILSNYRAAAASVETFKQKVAAADEEWKRAQASRLEKILLEIENPRLARGGTSSLNLSNEAGNEIPEVKSEESE